MTFLRLARMQCRRAVISPAFVVTALICAAVLVLNSVGAFDGTTSVTYLYMYAMLDINVFIICILPILPFGTSYAQEWQEKSVRFYLVRTGALEYAAAKFLAAVISGFLVVFLGFGLYTGVMLIWFPLGGNPGIRDSLTPLLKQNKTGLYLFSRVLGYGLSGALFSGLAIWFSTMFEERYAVLIMPFLAYKLLELILFVIFPQFATVWWFLGVPGGATPFLAVLQKLLFTGFALFLLCYGTVTRIERRVLGE